MFPLFSTFLALSTFAGALAAPIRPQVAASFSAGAAYFMTNDPQGNAVVSADIGSDGSLTLARVYPTSGNGLRGNSPFPGPDALFSQGAVVTHAQKGLLAAVNPGSNSIALFSINRDTPSQLTAVGFPVSSGGHFPMSVAFNNAGDMLCALNGGEINGVQCFAVNATSGLTSLGDTSRPLGLNTTTPPAGPFSTASQISFTPDDSQVVVAVKGAMTGMSGFLAWWDVSPASTSPTAAPRTLSQNNTVQLAPTGGRYPFSITWIPGTGRKAVLAADFNNGVDVFDLQNMNGTALQLPGQEAACWTTWSPKTGNFYVSDTGAGSVYEVAVNATLQPSFVNNYQFAATSGVIDLQVASLSSADYLYMLMAGTLSIGVMELGKPGGAQAVQMLNLTAPASAIGVTLDPAHIAGMAVFVTPQN